jgi:DNA-binding MarR family transcriptional regulator
VTHRLARRAAAAATETADVPCYRLDEQIGFLLRRATQRHLAIFAAGMRTQANGGGGNSAELTPMQWATLAKLYETGASAQNSLGRATAMDAATVKGVVDRLKARGLVESRADPADGRRRSVVLTASGRRHVEQAILQAEAITEATLAPLTDGERETLLALLKKLA